MLKIKCINNKPLKGNEIGPPLKIDDEYSIVDVYKCNCGLEHYDVGLKSEYNYISCRNINCSEKLPKGDKIHWCSPDRFIKINE